MLDKPHELGCFLSDYSLDIPWRNWRRMGCFLVAHVHLRYQVSICYSQLTFGPKSAGLIQMEFIDFKKEVLDNSLVVGEALNHAVHETSVAEVFQTDQASLVIGIQHSSKLQVHSPLNFYFYLFLIA